MKNPEWSAAYGPVFVLVLASFLILGVVQTGRPLWQDESLLIANFGLPWTAYFQALPFNDQAAPPLALMTHDLMWRLAGADVGSMRLLTLGLTVTVFAGIGHAAIRRQDITMLVALILLMTTPLVSNYSVEIKHYIFEFCAALLLFHAAITTNPAKGRAVVLLFALSVVLSLYSFSSMFVSVIILLDIVLFRARGRMRFIWLAALVGFVLTWGGLYIAIFKPMTYFQLNNYPEVYALHTLLSRMQSGIDGFLLPLVKLLAPVYFGIVIFGSSALLVTVALLLVWRKTAGVFAGIDPADRLLVRLGLGLLVALVLLSLLGQYPLFSDRQLLFTHPAKALMAAAFILYVCRVPTSAQWFRPALAVLVVALAGHGAVTSIAKVRSGDYVFQNSRALYDHLKTRAGIPVVPNELFAPTLRYYMAKDPQAALTVLGTLPSVTREIDDTATVVANLNAGAVDQLNTHIWAPLREGESYRAFTDFVVRIAVEAGHITFAAVQFGTQQQRFITDSATAAGCRATVDFVAAKAMAYDIRCNGQP